MWAPHDKTRLKTNTPATRSRVSLISAGIIGVLCGVGLLQLARQVSIPGPIVGDIISFTPDPLAAAEPAPRLAAYRPHEGGTCTLDLQAIRQSGGSLIVELRQQASDPVYRVHWSGLRTADDQSNCGADADLMLRGSDLEVLAQGAGGFGVAGKRYVAQTAYTSPGAAIP
jgi:hypothetical protein